MNKAKTITINSRKYDRSLRRSWHCSLIQETDDYFMFLGEFDEEIAHKELGVIRPGTVSYEYYWRNEYYNVFRFHEPDGMFRNFYCNVNMPPIFQNDTLDYIDLDIDILVWKDFSIEILDIDEYEENKRKYSYPVDLQHKISESVESLLSKIKHREFPFDISL